MKTMWQSKWMMAMAMVAVLSTQAVAQNSTATVQHTIAAPAKRLIVVSLQDRKLALLEDGKVTEIFAVAVGKPATPSPVGTFTIQRRVTNPAYYHDGKVIAPGPANPVGTRWMGLNIRGYGIHGTNAPGSIGKAASHGCIRMRRVDLERLFAEVRAGDTVELIGVGNQETAQIFGDPAPAPNSAPQPVLAADAHSVSATAPASTAGSM